MNQCDMLPSNLAGQTAYKQDHKNQCVHGIMQRAVFQADKEKFIIRIYLEDIILIWITCLFRGHNYCQNLILPITMSGQQKCIQYLDYFSMTKSLFGHGQ
jgi:hypothetical protein